MTDNKYMIKPFGKGKNEGSVLAEAMRRLERAEEIPSAEPDSKPLANPNPKPATARGNLQGYIQLDSGIYMAKERILLGKNWFDCNKELLKQGLHMPTIPEFIEFLKYLRANPSTENTEIYNQITEVRSPWRREWLDADFKMKGKELFINYNHILDSNGDLVPKNSEKLEDCLMENKTPGIDLVDWINNAHNKYGIPTEKVKDGNLYYWAPGKDNNSVARFYANSDGADLYCDRNPSDSGGSLGVRAVRRA